MEHLLNTRRYTLRARGKNCIVECLIGALTLAENNEKGAAGVPKQGTVGDGRAQGPGEPVASSLPLLLRL